MHLYTDDNPKTTLKGLGFKNKEKAQKTIILVEKYFNDLRKNQTIPGWTPSNVLPKKYIENKKECFRYYQKQKLYRILGMANRARGMKNKASDRSGILDAISIFEEWLNVYKDGSKKIVDCCGKLENQKKCRRRSDQKVFHLPRKFSRKKCLQKISGFTMRSSCAPFKDCS